MGKDLKVGNDLKAKLSQDVYTALKNIKAMSKELGGGRSKKEIDSTTEYNKLAQLLAGNGDVERNKMTDTDIKTLESELANAAKWKPVGDEFDSKAEKTEINEPKECTKEKEPAAAPDKGATAPDTDKKPEDKKRPEGNGESAPKPLPKQKTQTQNNNFNNSGINNSFNNNSGTIVIDKSIHYGDSKTDSTQNAPQSPDNNTPEDKSKAKRKEDTIRANKENYQVAYAEGEQVADDLIGPTTQKEKTRAIRNIMKQNENTIIGFMQGFYSNDTVVGIPYGIGDLLDLIDNEGAILFDAKWSDSEKSRAFIKVMISTLKYAKNTGDTENSNYKELVKLLNDVKSGKKINTETADTYIKELIMSGATDVNS